MNFSDFHITEALTNNKGSFKLNQSSPDDPEIKKSIEIFAKAKGIDVAHAQSIFDGEYAKSIENLSGSMINKNAVQNAAQSTVSNMLDQIDPTDLDLSEFGIDDPAEDLLDRDYFFDLTQYVLGENAQFFPLKNPFETKAVKPFFFVTPDHLPLMRDQRLKDAAEHHCKTAFCTPSAEMVFSRKFCERMALQALINKVKPKSKKYKSNGGKIPDHYCYLEFIMLHELLHFSAGDHFYTDGMIKKIQNKHPKISKKKAHTILNWVGDFINNWTLIKSGYEQLPVGLFSEDINYDKFETYEDIIDKVIEEIDKMKEDDLDKMSEEMAKSQDEHMENPDDTPNSGGADSEPSSKEDTKQKSDSGDDEGDGGGTPDDSGDDNPSDDEGDGDGTPGDPQDGDEGGDGSSQGGEPQDGDDSNDPQGGNQPSDDIGRKIDEMMKKNQQNIDKRDDGNDDAEGALDSPDDITDDEIKKKIQAGSAQIEYKDTTAVVNWKKILKKMIPAGNDEVEDTYAKMSRQATSSMVTAQQVGAGRISPGEVLVDSDKKGLCFIIDNSGSVMSAVNEFNQEIINLLKKNKKLLDNMWIIRFSNSFDVSKINIAKMKYQEVKNPETMIKQPKNTKVGSERPVKDLFSTSFGVGTEYTLEMHKVIKHLHESNINMIMFTDDDLTYDKRVINFYNLAKKRKNSVAMFITDDDSYKQMTNEYGKYKWITVLK